MPARDKDLTYRATVSRTSSSRGSVSDSSFGLPKKRQRISRQSIRYEAPCEIVILRGHEKGLVATRFIEEGELILQERPLFKLWQPQPSANDIQMQLIHLSAANKEAFYDLANSESEDCPVEKGIWNTNSFQIDNRWKGLFPIAARINSSCRPNVVYAEDRRLGALQFRAIRAICRGEELCHCYIPELLVRKAIRQMYKSNWDFYCHCELCDADEAEVAASDAGIQRANAIEVMLKADKGHPVLLDAEYYQHIRKLLDILKQECRPQQRLEWAGHAFKRAQASKDAALCRSWSRRCYKYSKLQLGPRDRETEAWAVIMKQWDRAFTSQTAQL